MNALNVWVLAVLECVQTLMLFRTKSRSTVHDSPSARDHVTNAKPPLRSNKTAPAGDAATVVSIAVDPEQPTKQVHTVSAAAHANGVHTVVMSALGVDDVEAPPPTPEYTAFGAHLLPSLVSYTVCKTACSTRV